jgi:predicted nucleic acid-binding protein
MGLRRKRIAKNDAEDFLLSLRDLHLRFVEPPAPDEILTLADDHGLTFYDASYLDLALRAHLPLASLDRDLVRAAERAGLRLFQP